MFFSPLHPGDRVGLLCCSNGLSPQQGPHKVQALCRLLTEFDLEPVLSPYLYRGETAYSGTDRERATALERCYRDPTVRAIFDLSGGDLANGVLSELDCSIPAQDPKPLFGYSDLTTLLNAIYTQTGAPGCLYSLSNQLSPLGASRRKALRAYLFGESDAFTQIRCRFVQGSAMEGVVVGGNLRCFLKLAGTPFFPSLSGKILLLESLGGGLPQVATLLNQLRQMGAFCQVNGVLLGTFTQYQSQKEGPPVEELVRAIAANPHLPIGKTEDVGHGEDAACMEIGVFRQFSSGSVPPIQRLF